MQSIQTRIQALNTHISQVAIAAGRNPEHITLIAVSKTRTVEDIKQAYAAGCRHFGESYVQEAVTKIGQLATKSLIWHFIGPIQSNKTMAIARHFDWVHSIDRLKIAQRLHLQRPEHLPPLAVCIQINISTETTKSGTNLAGLPELAEQIQALSRLRLRGLMAIARKGAQVTELHQCFATMRQTLEQLNSQGMSLDTLSMGMSNDFDVAIMEGATHVRVGTGIFGSREKSTQKL